MCVYFNGNYRIVLFCYWVYEFVLSWYINLYEYECFFEYLLDYLDKNIIGNNFYIECINVRYIYYCD